MGLYGISRLSGGVLGSLVVRLCPIDSFIYYDVTGVLVNEVLIFFPKLCLF